MKYTLICFTFNKVEEPKELGVKFNPLTLRNNWVDTVNNQLDLDELLQSLGFNSMQTQDALFKISTESVVKLSGDFTVANTRIIVHIIKIN